MKVICVCRFSHRRLWDQLKEIAEFLDLDITFCWVERALDSDSDYLGWVERALDGEFDFALILVDPPLPTSFDWLYVTSFPILALPIEGDLLSQWPSEVLCIKSVPLMDLDTTKLRAALENSLDLGHDLQKGRLPDQMNENRNVAKQRTSSTKGSKGLGFDMEGLSKNRSAREKDLAELSIANTEMGPFGASVPEPQGRVDSRPGKPELNTGFAPEGNPEQELTPDQYLETERGYYIWMQIGARLKGNINSSEAFLPVEELDAEAELFFWLEPLDDLISLTGEDGGVLKLTGRGTARVRDPLASVKLPERLRHQRLLIPIKTGAICGTACLQLNVACKNTLIQSYRIEAQVGASEGVAVGLKATLDYSLYKKFERHQLDRIEPANFSLAQSCDSGSHRFHFCGGGQSEMRSTMAVTDAELLALLELARRAFGQVAWGSANPWNKEKYRYETPEPGQLWPDLATLAKTGAQLFGVLRRGFAGVNRIGDATEENKIFMRCVRKPGIVQIAAFRSVRQVMPVAILYDLDIDAGAEVSRIVPCQRFLEDVKAGMAAQNTRCFRDGCTSEGNLFVCPSGFWGFRHRIGIPPGQEGDCVEEIPRGERVSAAMAVSTDPNFELRADHQSQLMALPGVNWKLAENREVALRIFNEEKYQLLYFYGHGVYTDDERLYLQVGDLNSRGILPVNLSNITWKDTKPLVILNGCHTTALVPTSPFDFVTPLLDARCSGVIGTEITLFEPLACRFMVLFLPLFLEGLPIGEALRQVRLALLAEHNPLGLIYTAFALASLRLAGREPAAAD